MRQRADLPDRVQQTGSGLVVGRVNQGNLRMLPERLLDQSQIRLLVHRKAEVDVGQAVGPADLHGAGGVGAVVYDQNRPVCGQEGVQADVDVHCAAAAEEDGGVDRRVCVDDLHQILPKSVHQSGKLRLAGTDIGHDLGVFHGVRRGGRTGIQQDIAFDSFHRDLLHVIRIIVGVHVSEK